MKFYSFKLFLALLVSLFLLSGCETLSTDEESEMVSDAPAETVDDGTSSAPAEPEISAQELAAQRAKEAAMKEQAALREIRTFYFDFDQTSVKTDARAALAAHAAFLSANPSTKIILEGHCDERGTKEYNIALGEGRAKSVARFLAVNGVSSSQIETISYGEERPASMGHDESGWSQNRRVYIEYK